MDLTSLRIANLLARNPPGAQALEITLSGPTLQILADCTLALAGADFTVTLENRAVDNWRAFHAPAGAQLKFGARQSGARAYLAVSGGLALERDVVQNEAIRLMKGDLLLGAPSAMNAVQRHIHLASSDRPSFDEPAFLRFVPAPHWSRFTEEARDIFISQEYEVSHESNRVGIRLAGPSLAFAPGMSPDIVSEPTPLGTVQVPASGLPILLMVDRPTTGGYAKIATVISADIGRAGQLAPGHRVRFELISLIDAQAAAKEHEARLRLLEQMATWRR